MPGITLADRLVAAADRFPTLDARVLVRPDRRYAHAADLAAERAPPDPPADRAAVAAALAVKLPPECPRMEDFRNSRFGAMVLKVVSRLDPDHPAQRDWRVRLYDGTEWLIFVSEWPLGDDDRATARRLLATLGGTRGSSSATGGQGDTPHQNCLIDFAGRDPREQILGRAHLFDGDGPAFPGWRPARSDDPWWAIRLWDVLDPSANAVEPPAPPPPPPGSDHPPVGVAGQSRQVRGGIARTGSSPIVSILTLLLSSRWR
jgi:hypothetical protein